MTDIVELLREGHTCSNDINLHEGAASEIECLRAEILRLRSLLEEQKEACARIAEKESFNCMSGEIWIASRIASAIRALPSPPQGEGK